MNKCAMRLACGLVLLISSRGWAADQPAAAGQARPNIIFILADDLGYGDLGCYGQKKIRTPNLDRMAGEGMRFTHFYAGSSVCAPSRCVLMTGRHSGHATVRDNARAGMGIPLRPEDATVAEALKSAGYATAAIGKWGLGLDDTPGQPNRKGFDHYFGFLDQIHAHHQYPAYVWKNREKFAGYQDKTYAQDLFLQEACDFLGRHRDRPFFLYLPLTLPHGELHVPEDSFKDYQGKFPEVPYVNPDGDKFWKTYTKETADFSWHGYRSQAAPRATYAAMVSRLDRDVGRLLARLKELGLDERTLVLFTSDNGPDYLGGSDPEFFNSSGSLRGVKRDLYEGGIRVPLLARWPGQIKAGQTCDLPFAFWDTFPTCCQIAGAKTPKDSDGVSFLPTLQGRGEQARHEFLYWEMSGNYGERGGQQAVRLGDWKGIRRHINRGQRDIELYHLTQDPGETKNLAAQHPDIVTRIAEIMKREHTPSEAFPLRTLDKAGK